MEKKTVFIKRYPSNGELPKEDGTCIVKSINGVVRTSTYKSSLGYFVKGVIGGDIRRDEIEYFLEEIELPSEEEMQSEIYHESMEAEHAYDFQQGAKHMQNFILNHLKSNTNG